MSRTILQTLLLRTCATRPIFNYIALARCIGKKNKRITKHSKHLENQTKTSNDTQAANIDNKPRNTSNNVPKHPSTETSVLYIA